MATICASCSSVVDKNMNTPPLNDNMTSSAAAKSPYRKVLAHASRKIGYTICQASTRQPEPACKTAILWFYPLSGDSSIVENAAASFSCYKASVISVDRPSVGDTDAMLRRTDSAVGNNPSLERIKGHAEDVLAVLRHHKIERVYLLGVCLGHVYAIQVARRLLQMHGSGNCTKPTTTTTTTTTFVTPPTLQGMALVAPFVSTACPHAWGVARFGSRVPTFVLAPAVSSLTSLGTVLVPKFLTANRVQKLISEEEQKEFGWTTANNDNRGENDFDQVVTAALQMNKSTRHSKSTEAQLGADPAWQQICDCFAAESGCGLIIDDYNDNVEKEQKDCQFPISIYACRDDKIAPLASVLWVARRCYGMTDETQVAVEERIHSHEVMTMMGGPPRNPVLLHKIAQTWGLVDDSK